MKNIKKFFAVLIALVMSISMATTAFAADTYSITINNSNTGHTYEAYQIFSGSLSKNGVLSDIQWGYSVSDTGKNALGKAASKAETLVTEADAKAFADEVAKYLTSPVGSANAPTDGKYVISGLSTGYYLVKDKDNSLQGGNDSYTSYILKVVADVTADPKSDAPESAKKVMDTNDTTGATTGWQDSADYDIGDKVPFQLTGTLPANYSEYETYTLIFHDTESAGLTFDKDSVKVYVDGKAITSGYTVVTEGLDDGCTFEVRFADVKSIAAATDGSVITVEYNSLLNENAVIGAEGNKNTMNMEYSNNPNAEQGGTPGDTGKTPDDTAIVFTYQTVINKVDENNAPLTGAEFTLEKKLANGRWETISVVKNDEGTIFTFAGLDDGDYRLKETKTPDGYNSIDPIEFTITAEHEVLSDVPALTSLNGNATSGEITLVSNLANGSLTSNIVNQSGSTLPSTGGIGTTIFYIVGAVLVLGAVVLLITKKRVGTAK